MQWDIAQDIELRAQCSYPDLERNAGYRDVEAID